MLFKDTFDKIQENAQRKKEGRFNTIPFDRFPRLNRHIPGLIQGKYYILTASSGIGKTQITKQLFVLEPYRFIKENPKAGIKLKILYFALEESKRSFMLGLISNRLKKKYNISKSTLDLQSFNSILEDNVIEKIKECGEYFNELEQSIDVIDSITNPTGIYKYVNEYSKQNGTHHFKDLLINGKKEKVYSHYIPNNPDEYVIVIVDHISLLQEESGLNKHKTMSRWSSDYALQRITKHYNYVMVNVQQQEAMKEKQEFYRGMSIESKLEPSLDGLADNKLTQRDADFVLGLFAPSRYEIPHHLGYDIKIMKDNYRSLKVLKNRDGIPNLKLGLYFDGEINHFAELPPPKLKNGELTPEIQSIYNNLKEKNFNMQKKK